MASSATRVTASHQRLPQAPDHSVLGREFSRYRMDEIDFVIVKENCVKKPVFLLIIQNN